jgi:uncharacterized protein YdiU (UPF0061 family)
MPEELPPAAPLRFDNSYARLPERFHARQPLNPVAAPRLLRVNEPLARELGIDPAWLAGPDGVALVAGNRLPPGADPVAMAYAGHQFGHFNPRLGDGRALLVGELLAPDGSRWDLHLKGSGRTPFSRRGDGRAALGPVLREFLVSEAMAALGVPTTRVLAAVTTGERVQREDGMLPGAVLARVARGHLRIGTFEYFAARNDTEGLRLLADHALARFDPAAAGAAEPYRALFDGVVRRTAALVARWMSLGFIHGVMNTDNLAISGETIDYGPCAFIDTFSRGAVFSSIDEGGRYAWGNQPGIAHWNLVRLAEALLPLLGASEEAALASAQAALDAFPALYEAAFLDLMRGKLGLQRGEEGDAALVSDLLARLEQGSVDFTNFFRRLSACGADPDGSADEPVRSLFAQPAAFDAWAQAWRARLSREASGSGADEARCAAMRAVNPAFIPRNHRVEAALVAAERSGDLGPFDALLEVVRHPFDERPDRASWTAPPAPHEVVHATFCGT